MSGRYDPIVEPELEELAVAIAKICKMRLSSRNAMRPWKSQDRKIFLDDLAYVCIAAFSARHELDDAASEAQLAFFLQRDARPVEGASGSEGHEQE